MQYILHNKYEKPAFSFLVKINTSISITTINTNKSIHSIKQKQSN